MYLDDLAFWKAYSARKDLLKYKGNSLLLFALQMKFGFEDIKTIAENSITDGSEDQGIDLLYIDAESGQAVVAQAYQRKGNIKKGEEAPSSKASKLGSGITWLLSRDIKDLPDQIRSHAQELREEIKNGNINSLYIWYVHNLKESSNVEKQLKTVQHLTRSILNDTYDEIKDLEVFYQEIGQNSLEELYKELSAPIFVSETFTIPIEGGFEIGSGDWSAFVTTIDVSWLYDKFREFGDDLTSANVRDYLGSRKTDKNINEGIKSTAKDNPEHFWIYNNGITALVNDFKEIKRGKKHQLEINGISIINGAQTTGAIGSLGESPTVSAKIPIRFIKCNNEETLHNIVRYNNSQNKIASPDFRSRDRIQKKVEKEFERIPGIEYAPRRGGFEERLTRTSNIIPSIIAGQALAAFHGEPRVAYHQKAKIWDGVHPLRETLSWLF